MGSQDDPQNLQSSLIRWPTSCFRALIRLEYILNNGMPRKKNTGSSRNKINDKRKERSKGKSHSKLGALRKWVENAVLRFASIVEDFIIFIVIGDRNKALPSPLYERRKGD